MIKLGTNSNLGSMWYIVNSKESERQLIGCAQYGGQCRQSLGLAMQTLGWREKGKNGQSWDAAAGRIGLVGCSNRDRDTLTEKEKNRIGPHISLASTPYNTASPLHSQLLYYISSITSGPISALYYTLHYITLHHIHCIRPIRPITNTFIAVPSFHYSITLT